MFPKNCSNCEFACLPVKKILELVQERCTYLELKPIMTTVHNNEIIMSFYTENQATYLEDDLCELVYEDDKPELCSVGHMGIEAKGHLVMIDRPCA